MPSSKALLWFYSVFRYSGLFMFIPDGVPPCKLLLQESVILFCSIITFSRRTSWIDQWLLTRMSHQFGKYVALSALIENIVEEICKYSLSIFVTDNTRWQETVWFCATKLHSRFCSLMCFSSSTSLRRHKWWMLKFKY